MLVYFGFFKHFPVISSDQSPQNKCGGDKMLLDVASGGFALSLALTNRTDLVSEDMNPEERREALEKIRSRQLEQEVGILVNQIGKMDQPPG